MKKNDFLAIQSLTWHDCRAAVQQVRPDLAAVIDQLNPDKDHLIYRAIYPFGAMVAKNGVLYLPTTSGETVPINHPYVPSFIKEDLAYSNIPLSLICQKTVEVFFEMANGIFPLRLFKPGILLLWEALDPPTTYHARRIWNIAAGARSIFMLPKISDAAAYKQLKSKYSLKASLPKTIAEHYHVFTEIIHQQSNDQKWKMEIVFFGAKWLERRVENNGWLRFHHFLLEEAWNLAQYSRNKETLAVVWKLFSQTLIKRRIKPNTYLLETVKHLLDIATGALPAFKAAGNSELAGPVQTLQKIYMSDYKLRCIPTIMVPHHFNMENKDSVYYSLQYPTMLESFPKTRTPTSTINDLRDLKELVEHFLLEAQAGSLRVENTPYYKLLNKVDINYFHNEPDLKNGIISSHKLPLDDSSLTYYPPGFGKRNFAENSSFLRGCVRISSRKPEAAPADSKESSDRR